MLQEHLTCSGRREADAWARRPQLRTCAGTLRAGAAAGWWPSAPSLQLGGVPGPRASCPTANTGAGAAAATLVRRCALPIATGG